MNWVRKWLFGGPTRVWTGVHIPFGQHRAPSHTPSDPTEKGVEILARFLFGQLPAPSHTPSDRTERGTEHLAGFDTMENQTTRNLQYKHPPIHRWQRWSWNEEHKLICIRRWKGNSGTLSVHPLFGQELYIQDTFCWWYSGAQRSGDEWQLLPLF